MTHSDSRRWLGVGPPLEFPPSQGGRSLHRKASIIVRCLRNKMPLHLLVALPVAPLHPYIITHKSCLTAYFRFSAELHSAKTNLHCKKPDSTAESTGKRYDVVNAERIKHTVQYTVHTSVCTWCTEGGCEGDARDPVTDTARRRTPGEKPAPGATSQSS